MREQLKNERATADYFNVSLMAKTDFIIAFGNCETQKLFCISSITGVVMSEEESEHQGN